jgi:hypothetical protein
MKSEARLGELLGPKVVSRQWSKNRVCGYGDCTVILSRYNPSENCTVHRASTVLGRREEEPKEAAEKPSSRRKAPTKKSSARQKVPKNQK